MEPRELPLRPLGASGVVVAALGLGCGALGEVTASEAEALLSCALDAGITLWDTARSYGDSEARIGRHPRRREATLSTKLGYGVEGVPDWTAESVARGVDGALSRLGVDRVDVVHLHSCPLEVLQRGEVVEALEAARRLGKLRVAAYSGEGEALAWAVRSGRFGAVQCSMSVCDQGSLRQVIPQAAGRGVGVLGKRSLANGGWVQTPAWDAEGREYRRRFAALDLEEQELPWEEVFLRFAAHAPGVSAALVGTRSSARLLAHAAAVARGPLSHDLSQELRERFSQTGPTWPGLI